MIKSTIACMGIALLTFGCSSKENHIKAATREFESFTGQLKHSVSIKNLDYLVNVNSSEDTITWFNLFSEQTMMLLPSKTLEVNGLIKPDKELNAWGFPGDAVEVDPDEVQLIYRVTEGRFKQLFFNIRMKMDDKKWKIISQSCWGFVSNGKWVTFDHLPNGKLAQSCKDFQNEVGKRKGSQM